jgi:hypothetical protein
MENNDLKGKIINNYLNQQLQETQNGGNALQPIELPDASILEEFKNHVRLWIENDNMIKKLRGVIKERNVVKTALTEKILKFMAKYNIEDLNTKDGSKLRYHVTTSKAAPTKSEIKERLTQYVGTVNDTNELIDKVFEKSNTKESVTLRRFQLRPN